MKVSPDKVNYLAKLKIEKILVDENSEKDIALFVGKYIKFKGKADKSFVANCKTKVSKSKKSKKSVDIHHYPLGIEDQRLNEGRLKNDIAHYVSTLPGSSGAALLTKSNKRLIGIHTGRDVNVLKKVKYTGDALSSLTGREFDLVDNNTHVSITRDELQNFNKIFEK